MKNKEEQDDRVWVQLYDFEDYLICAEGEIKSKDREGVDSSGRRYAFSSKPLKARNNKKNPHEFVEVTYDENGKKRKKTIYVHRAVAEHFLNPPRENEQYIIHINDDHSDNSAENLKWATKEELAKVHYKTRVASTRRSWATRRRLYGESGIKPTKNEKKSK